MRANQKFRKIFRVYKVTDSNPGSAEEGFDEHGCGQGSSSINDGIFRFYDYYNEENKMEIQGSS